MRWLLKSDRQILANSYHRYFEPGLVMLRPNNRIGMEAAATDEPQKRGIPDAEETSSILPKGEGPKFG